VHPDRLTGVIHNCRFIAIAPSSAKYLPILNFWHSAAMEALHHLGTTMSSTLLLSSLIAWPGRGMIRSESVLNARTQLLQRTFSVQFWVRVAKWAIKWEQSRGLDSYIGHAILPITVHPLVYWFFLLMRGLTPIANQLNSLVSIFFTWTSKNRARPLPLIYGALRPGSRFAATSYLPQ